MTSLLGAFRRLPDQRSVSFQDVWGTGADLDGLSGNPRVAQLAITSTLGCVDIKAASITAMPLHQYRTEGEIRRKIKRSALIDDPSSVFSPDEWVYAAVASMSLWDEAIGMVAATGRDGWPSKIEWLVPSDVTKRVIGGMPQYTIGGVTHSAFKHGGPIVHIRRRPLPGRADGSLSTAKAIGPLVSIGLEGARAAVANYLAGGLPLASLQWDGELSQSEADAVSTRYVQARRKNPGRPLVVGKGWTFNTHERGSITADLPAIRKQVATEVAVAHSVPPEMVGGESGGGMTYSNLEGLTRHLEVRTLLPIYTVFERALSRLLPQPQFVRFNADAIVRTSLLDRMRSHDIAIRAGMRSPDESRVLENEPPIPNGQGEVFLWPPYSTSPEVRRDPE